MKVCTKTARRMVRCLEENGVPLYFDKKEHISFERGYESVVVRCDRRWLQQFFRLPRDY